MKMENKHNKTQQDRHTVQHTTNNGYKRTLIVFAS